MGEIVNLRTARKRKIRENEARIAEQNRTLHGISKVEKLRNITDALKLDTHLDGHRISPPKNKPGK